MLTCTYTKLAHTFNDEKAADAGFSKFQYRRLHIPSGNVSDGFIFCYNLTVFRTLMAAWNRIGSTTWKYWEVWE